MIYYNDFEPFVCEWLKNLIAAGHLPAGDVDNRSIKEVTAHDVAGYTQCHFFAGIGGWAYALKLAGWPEDQPVWTGSCPCQPFSAAGRGKGADDARHLWPEWFRLIAECRPPVLFGEQVASKDGRAWLGAVRADLETVGYAVGAADLCAAGVGAPHIRQRLWFAGSLDDATSARQQPAWQGPESEARDEARLRVSRNRRWSGLMGDAIESRLEGHGGDGNDRSESGRDGTQSRGSIAETGAASILADTERGTTERRGHDVGSTPSGAEAEARERQRIRLDAGPGDESRVLGHAAESRCEGLEPEPPSKRQAEGRLSARSSDARLVAHADGRQPCDGDVQRGGEHGQQPQDRGASSWDPCDWLPCRDGKARPVEPGTFPLAHGIPARVGRLRAYGNAIVPEAAETFIRSVMECQP